LTPLNTTPLFNIWLNPLGTPLRASIGCGVQIVVFYQFPYQLSVGGTSLDDYRRMFGYVRPVGVLHQSYWFVSKSLNDVPLHRKTVEIHSSSQNNELTMSCTHAAIMVRP
jgi:hypothetical protein